MTKELIHKFLNNNCSPKELEAVISWIKTESPLIEGEKWTLEEWQTFKGEKQWKSDEVYSSMLDKIHHKINIQSADKVIKIQAPNVSLLTWITRIAALLLLPVVAFLLFTLSQHNLQIKTITEAPIDSLEIVAPVGSKTIVQLPDGSEVYLNHGSKLKYPQKFIGSSRNVILSGEGYFKVAHNPNKPFIVSTPEMNINALGTEFNILAYPSESIIEATLVNGVVTLDQINLSGTKQSLGSMQPSQHVRFHKETGKVVSTMGNIEKYISWKEGRLIFKNEPIEQIANRLNRWYNVEIVFENEEVKDLTYTATFVDETLFQILDLMELATPIKYKAMPRKKLESGTFSKQKIIIGLKN